MKMRLEHKKNRSIGLPLLVLVILSLACAAPGLVAPVGTPTAGAPTMAPVSSTDLPTAEAQPPAPGDGGAPAARAADLPPALVETDPLPRSELLPGSQPVFYFNQPMDRPSVEAAFQAQPALTGRFEWVDDATLRYVIDALPGPQQDVALTIQTGARAANGLALPQPVEVTYRTPGPLRAAHRLPEPGAQEVDPSSAVVASFNHPVVPLGVDSANLPPGITLDPAPAGAGEWINTSTYIFYPQPALPGGTRFTARPNPDLVAFTGLPADEAGLGEWSFTTAAPRLVGVEPESETPVALDAVFRFTFNQPMDRPSTEADFALADDEGTPVPGKFAWNERGDVLSFTPDALLERGSVYTLILLGAAASQGGTPVTESYAARLQTYPALSALASDPPWLGLLDTSGGYGMIRVSFSAPLKPNQDWKSLVSITPSVGSPYYSLNEDGTQLILSGIFEPSTSYDLSISTDLRDRWDGMLDQTFFVTFSTGRADPSLVVPVLQTGYPAIFIPQGETEIPARITNVSRVSLSRGDLTLPEFLQALDFSGNVQPLDWDSKIQSSWVKLFYLAENATEAAGLPMTQTERAPDPGLYFLRIRPDETELAPGAPPALLVVSPIQLTVKVSSRQAFVWAVRLDGSTPAADLVVSFYDSQVNVLGTCATGADGTCQADIPARSDAYNPVYAVIGLPGDPNFSLASSSWNLGVTAWDFNLPFELRTSLEDLYLYTDRPIYRPGQAVNFRAVARTNDNGRYALPAVTEGVFRVETYDPVSYQSRVVDEMRLPLTPFGSASGAFRLPEGATPGMYTLSDANHPGASINFEVAEYRKPEIDLNVTFAQPASLRGSDLSAGVQARYYFGAPAGNLEARWMLFALEESPLLPGGLSTGALDLANLRPMPPRGLSNLGYYVMEGQDRTAADGSMLVSVPAEKLEGALRPGKAYRLTLEVVVTDESGLPLAGSATTLLHPSETVIGVRPESWMGVADQESIFYVRTFDWRGSILPQQNLKARFRKVSWVQEEEPSGMITFRAEFSDAGSTDFNTSDQGEARLSFLPSEPGTFLLEITKQGEESGGPITEQLLWVGGEGSATWPNLMAEQIALRRDAEQYEAGQSARIFIPNPFGAPALTLITVERGRVMQSSVVTIEGSGYTLELPLTDQEAPNVYVSALLLGRLNNQPAFRAGYVELRVDPRAMLLDVTVETSPQQPAPGEELTLNVRVKDAAGSPVQGEFSMAIVDKAVLALADPNAPGIVSAYYDPQPLEVLTGLALSVYSRRFPNLPPGRGGGGGDMALTPPLRTKFEDTAYWNGALVTDVDGVAQVTVRLPDNLTTWQVDTRGITADGRVGEARTELVVGKPLLVRPVTPRFVVLGDHLRLGAVVQNNTTEALQAEVSLDPTGFRLDDAAQSAQVVDLPPGERALVTWWGTVEDVDVLDLVFTATAGSLRDSTRPTQGPVRVLRYAAPQVFATGGVLDSPGERIETVSLPRSFTPAGGGLRVEVAPSLAGFALESLEDLAQSEAVTGLTETDASGLLARAAVYRLAADFQLRDEAYRGALKSSVEEGIARLRRLQNGDGSWGWTSGQPGDPLVTAYALYALGRASQAGLFVEPEVIQRAQEALVLQLATPIVEREDWELDRLAFQTLALQQTGYADLDFDALYDLRNRLSAWGKASLALALSAEDPEDERARALLSDLQAGAQRSATGAHWEPPRKSWQNWAGPTVMTAAAVEAIARLDPASPLLADAERYLALNRRALQVWGSSYASAWAIQALAEAARAAGDTQAGYEYAVDLDGAALMAGRMEGGTAAQAWVEGGRLQAGVPSALRFERGEGSGRMVYTAALEVARPVENAPAVRRGLTLTRAYSVGEPGCGASCPPVSEIPLDVQGPVYVRLTLVVPDDMANVAVEDWIPAGAEILNARLKTSQQGAPIGFEEPAPEGETVTPYDPSDPFMGGWGGWLFQDPVVRDDRVRWTAAYLPAGTYELVYRLEVFLPGEFRVLPARAWQIYFPEVEGSSAGEVLVIRGE